MQTSSAPSIWFFLFVKNKTCAVQTFPGAFVFTADEKDTNSNVKAEILSTEFRRARFGCVISTCKGYQVGNTNPWFKPRLCSCRSEQSTLWVHDLSLFHPPGTCLPLNPVPPYVFLKSFCGGEVRAFLPNFLSTLNGNFTIFSEKSSKTMLACIASGHWLLFLLLLWFCSVSGRVFWPGNIIIRTKKKVYQAQLGCRISDN